jgi:sulfide:quinone oxidoreductase
MPRLAPVTRATGDGGCRVIAGGSLLGDGAPTLPVREDAERRAGESVVAAQIVARLRGQAEPVAYDGQGTCYLEFGRGLVGRVTVTFLSGQAPTGDLEGPSLEIAAGKDVFGASRIARWFGREWPEGAVHGG